MALCSAGERLFVSLFLARASRRSSGSKASSGHIPSALGMLYRVFLKTRGHPTAEQFDCEAVDSRIEQGSCSADSDTMGGEVAGVQTLADARNFDCSRDFTRVDVSSEDGGHVVGSTGFLKVPKCSDGTNRWVT